MTSGPSFDELVGHDLPAEERERLLQVHELLLQAGPPAELSPEIEAGPTLAMTLARQKREHQVRHRVGLLAAAVVAIAVVFLGGYIVGNSRTGGNAPAKTMELSGTAAAPGALASLRIEHADSAGNWPMVLSVTGLPKLPDHAYYVVYLVRGGKPWAPCGTFVVSGPTEGTNVRLNAPYELKKGDTWWVMKQLPGGKEPRTAVLVPAKNA
ncbi:MAG TPA: hypothetical protein VEG24_03225 [Gaiellaceae bacterium]|nr:hypothetical protein [Gaiellaceae bacterium]